MYEIKLKNYIIRDMETQNPNYKGVPGNPFDPDAWVVCYVEKYPHTEAQVFYKREGVELTPILDAEIYVGHNVAYDLKWELAKNPMIATWICGGGEIWDTMLAEYIITGHWRNMENRGSLGLDALAEKYGGTLKDDRIKALWKAGTLTADIDKALLVEYAKHDGINTELVYLGQVQAAKKLGLLPLLRVAMESRLSTILCEMNGMQIDLDLRDALIEESKPRLAKINQEVSALCKPMFPDLDYIINLGSPLDNSIMLFGGNLKYKATEPVRDANGNIVVVKTKSSPNYGKPKTKQVTKEYKVKGLGAVPKPEWLNSKGVYSVSDDTRKDIYLQHNENVNKYLDLLTEYRAEKRTVSTYLIGGMTDKLYPDGRMRGHFNHSTTVTGRKSSSGPNLQNFPSVAKSKAKFCIVSRYPGGVILSADYSQLEPTVKGWLTQDQDWVDDVNNGLDFHCKYLALSEQMDYEEVYRLAKVDKVPEWVEKRRAIKGAFTFASEYGAGPASVAKKINMPIEDVKKIFEAKDRAYPVAAQYFDDLEDELKTTQIPWKEDPVSGKMQHIGWFRNLLGHIWCLGTSIRKTKRNKFYETYYRPSILNTPMQGSANDIMNIAGTLLLRELYLKYPEVVRPIGEIHDEFLMDVRADSVDKVAEIVRECLEVKMPQYIEEHFKVKVNVPFKCSIEVGKSWGDAK